MWLLILSGLFIGLFVYLNMKRIKPDDTVENIQISYVGLEEQQQKNKRNLKIMFALYPLPVLLIVLFFAAINIVLGIVVFAIFAIRLRHLYKHYADIISKETGQLVPIERKNDVEKLRDLYNLLENLSIECELAQMPRLSIIMDDSLNAFASGIKAEDYTVTLTTGLIKNLNDDEMRGVMAHELAHICNGDVKIMTLSMVFNRIFGSLPMLVKRATAAVNRFCLKLARHGGDGAEFASLLGLIGVLYATMYGFMIGMFMSFINFSSTVMHFAISRKQEYIADAEAARLIGNPQAVASALRKISDNPYIATVKNADVAAMFISNPCKNLNVADDKQHKFDAMFKRFFFLDDLTRTHPDIRKRIKILEQI